MTSEISFFIWLAIVWVVLDLIHSISERKKFWILTDFIPTIGFVIWGLSLVLK